MLLHETLRQREPQTGATFAAGHQRIKDAVADVLRNARPVVDHLQFKCQPVALLGQRDLTQRTGAADDFALRLSSPARRCARY